MKHFSIIISKIFHREHRNPVIPFKSNLFFIQHSYLLNFCRLGTFWKIIFTEPDCLCRSYKLFFSFLFWTTFNAAVSHEIQHKSPTLFTWLTERSPSSLPPAQRTMKFQEYVTIISSCPWINLNLNYSAFGKSSTLDFMIIHWNCGG